MMSFSIVFFITLFLFGLCNTGLHAAPLESGFALAPSVTASPAEKAAAYNEARLRVVNAAGKYERTPYRYGGLDRRGLDCSGLVYVSFQDALGVSVPRNSWGLYSWVERIQIQDARPGDLVFFATGGSGTVSHVGIFVGDRRFIHSASDGPSTGVIYSSLDESYWSRTYVGAGRALPSAETSGSAAHNPGTSNTRNKSNEKSPESDSERERKFLFGFAAAPTLNIEGAIFRGITGQFRMGVVVKSPGYPTILGMELRPEWDGAYGVLRLPLTLSWGVNDMFHFFAGPAFSYVNSTLSIDSKNRQHTGETGWIGMAGVTVVPFAFKVNSGHLSPYAELVWRPSFDRSDKRNFVDNFYESINFCTGLRYTWRK